MYVHKIIFEYYNKILMITIIFKFSNIIILRTIHRNYGFDGLMRVSFRDATKSIS